MDENENAQLPPEAQRLWDTYFVVPQAPVLSLRERFGHAWPVGSVRGVVSASGRTIPVTITHQDDSYAYGDSPIGRIRIHMGWSGWWLDESEFVAGPPAYRVAIGEEIIDMPVIVEPDAWLGLGGEAGRKTELRVPLLGQRELSLGLVQLKGQPWTVSEVVVWEVRNGERTNWTDLPISAAQAL